MTPQQHLPASRRRPRALASVDRPHV